MLNQNSLKFILRFLFIVAVAVVVWALVAYFDSDARQEREALRYWEDLKEEYESDTFGGETPEETLELFISALEAEDIKLASMYFLPDERDEIKIDLKKEFNIDGNFSIFISNLKKFNRTKSTDPNRAFFIIIGSNGVVANQITMAEHPTSGIWKITDL